MLKKHVACIIVTNAFDNVKVPCSRLPNLLTNLISKDDVICFKLMWMFAFVNTLVVVCNDDLLILLNSLQGN